MVPALIILGVVLLLPLIWLIGNYNRLASLRQHVRESWADIDVELKRRYELIPNLVSTVKGYAAHEHETLERITELRNIAAANHTTARSQASDESSLMREVGRLLLIAEQYPNLKADTNFLALQQELANTEDRIAASRRFYNANVRDMTQLCEMFPSNIVAKMFGFTGGDYFELASDAERVVPRVEM